MEKLNEFIRQKRNEKGISLRDFAKICDLSHSYIDKLEKGVDPRNNKPVIPTIDTLQKISNALNYNLVDFLKETGYLSEDILIIDTSSDEINKEEVDRLMGELNKIING